MELLLTHLSPKERQLLLLIRERGLILTRIKERGAGDVESVQPPVVPRRDGGAVSHHPPLDEGEVLTCLHALEAHGLVRSNTTVLRASTTEYVCEWTLCNDR
jgi:hypothetical protein